VKATGSETSGRAWPAAPTAARGHWWKAGSCPAWSHPVRGCRARRGYRRCPGRRGRWPVRTCAKNTSEAPIFARGGAWTKAAAKVLHPLPVQAVLLRVLERQRRLVDRLLAGLRRLVLDVAHQPALIGVGQLGRALDRRRAADHRLHLAVFQVCLPRQRPERVRRVRDRPLVVAVLRPVLAVDERLRGPGRRPERQHVVDDVAVQVDQARIDRPARPHAADRPEAARGRVGA
jgi:hypothetical protein